MAIVRRPLKGYENGNGVFGERLKKTRNEKGLSVTELAEQIGIHVSQITGAENRGVIPMLRNAILLAIALDCTLDYLCGLENEDGLRDIHSDIEKVCHAC